MASTLRTVKLIILANSAFEVWNNESHLEDWELISLIFLTEYWSKVNSVFEQIYLAGGESSVFLMNSISFWLIINSDLYYWPCAHGFVLHLMISQRNLHFSGQIQQIHQQTHWFSWKTKTFLCLQNCSYYFLPDFSKGWLIWISVVLFPSFLFNDRIHSSWHGLQNLMLPGEIWEHFNGSKEWRSLYVKLTNFLSFNWWPLKY